MSCRRRSRPGRPASDLRAAGLRGHHGHFEAHFNVYNIYLEEQYTATEIISTPSRRHAL